MMKYLGILICLALLLTLPGFSAAAAPNEECGESYTVKRGDSIYKIARLCGVSQADLLDVNPHITNPRRIYVGQVLIMPYAAAATETALVISPAQGPPETEINVTGRGFSPGEIIRLGMGISWQEMAFSTEVRADERGSFTISIVIPEAARPGENWVIGKMLPTNNTRTAATALEDAFDPDDDALRKVFEVIEAHLVYVVKRGDRLSNIAARHNTTLAGILDLNPDIENPHRIFAGQKIIIPPVGYQPSEEAIARARERLAAPPPAGIPSNVKVSPEERWINVNLSTQTLHAYIGEQVVRSFIVSTGKSSTPTVTGQYRIYVKLMKTDMRGPGYHLRDVPYTMYFYKGYGIHGTYWHTNFGTPVSAGCVNMTRADAEWLFNFASVGTLVNVHR
jgi:lipoprotein-anchoring transpeptidase ErfK/SrfK